MFHISGNPGFGMEDAPTVPWFDETLGDWGAEPERGSLRRESRIFGSSTFGDAG
jgi:hypothetical protein